MKYLSDNGFVPFFESVRRHEVWPRKSTAQKNVFTNYTRYLIARYGCYNMIYSWLHWDTDNQVYPDWLSLASDNESFALGLYTQGFPATFVTGLEPKSDYIFEWWQIEEGGWMDATIIQSDASGKLSWPRVPDTSRNWAYRLRLKG